MTTIVTVDNLYTSMNLGGEWEASGRLTGVDGDRLLVRTECFEHSYHLSETVKDGRGAVMWHEFSPDDAAGPFVRIRLFGENDV